MGGDVLLQGDKDLSIQEFYSIVQRRSIKSFKYSEIDSDLIQDFRNISILST